MTIEMLVELNELFISEVVNVHSNLYLHKMHATTACYHLSDFRKAENFSVQLGAPNFVELLESDVTLQHAFRQKRFPTPPFTFVSL